MKYMIRNARLSFPHLWEKSADGTSTSGEKIVGSYQANALITPDDKQVQELTAIINQVFQDRMGENKNFLQLAQGIWNQDRVPLHNGDMKADYDGYAGMWYFSAKSDVKPLILDVQPWLVDAEGKPLRDQKGKLIPNELKADAGRPYGGCYCNFSVDIFAYTKPKPGVSATLKGVQYVSDGDAFAGGPPADPEDFEDLSQGAGQQQQASGLESMM